jgi:hypothetical protein
MRTLIAAIVLSIGLPAKANTWGTDLTDLWYNPSESGWGINIVHQERLLFLTFFLYGANGAPVWYSASDVQFAGTTSGGAWIFSGGLYQTTGPWFGVPSYNSSLVNYRQVGTITVTVPEISAATVTYSVDGVTVQKNVQRAALKANDASGTYVGAMIGTYSSCIRRVRTATLKSL